MISQVDHFNNQLAQHPIFARQVDLQKFHTFCSVDIDECYRAPSQNNETCTDKVNSYACMCVHGYTGSNCEISKSVAAVPITGRMNQSSLVCTCQVFMFASTFTGYTLFITSMTYRFSRVIGLPVHLPSQHQCSFSSSDESV